MLKNILYAIPVGLVAAGLYVGALSAFSVSQPLVSVPASKNATATLQPAQTVYVLQPTVSAQQLQPTVNPQQTVSGTELQ